MCSAALARVLGCLPAIEAQTGGWRCMCRGPREVRSLVMASALIIEATSLRKAYHNGAETVEALRGINFAVTPGEMVAIMGPSGCGKTTLLNCLSGLDDFDAGEVRIAGTPLRDMSDNQK